MVNCPNADTLNSPKGTPTEARERGKVLYNDSKITWNGRATACSISGGEAGEYDSCRKRAGGQSNRAKRKLSDQVKHGQAYVEQGQANSQK